jgi:arylamine N-acetyltransferase
MKNGWLFYEDKEYYIRYLNILGIVPHKPSFNSLAEILNSHLVRIPFENISKLYYRKKFNQISIPSFEQFLQGIEKFNLGGTCFAINYYLCCLLNHLGYDAKLCGADTSQPDTHIVIIVKINNQDYLVDAGNAAPFFDPIPLSIKDSFQITRGGESYVFEPGEIPGTITMKHYRNGTLKYFYTVNPEPKNIDYFHPAITDSFKTDAVFMNSVYLAKMSKDVSVTLHNFTLTKSEGKITEIVKLENWEGVIEKIVNIFSISENIITAAIDGINTPVSVWDIKVSGI